MARIRINFGPDFCGKPPCDICFRDGDEAYASKAKELRKQEQREKELGSYNQYNAEMARRRAITNKFKVQQEAPATVLAQIKCPKCGVPMVVRVNRNTQQKFMGCRSFPDCRGTRPYPQTLEKISVDIEATPTKPITVEFPKPEEIKWDLAVQNEATTKGKLKVLEKEKPKPGAVTVLKNETPKEPVKEVTFDILLNRPVNRVVEEGIKTEGKFGSIEFLDDISREKEKKHD